MAYNTDLPSIEEARLDAIYDLIVANLAALNASLGRDSLWPASVPITAAMVTIGDPETTLDVNAYPILICVVGGGRGDERDIESDYLYIDSVETGGLRNVVYTNVYFYLHPDAVPGTDVIAQAEMRERVRARACDWLRAGIFNDVANRAIPLASQEYSVAPNFDRLDRCRAAIGYKGYFEKGFGGITQAARGKQTLYGAHIVHIGEVM